MMNDEKLRSEEVPSKFSEWLLAMGCPPETVPSTEKLSEMCRGQYDMVWRSLMEHVKSKDKISFRRNNVFCDDVQRCKSNNVFCEQGTNVVVPEEIKLWHEHVELKKKTAHMEAQVEQKKNKLYQTLDKRSSKMAQRDLSSRRLQDTLRRAWLLHQVLEELKAKKENLKETKSISESLCQIDEDLDIMSKLDKCLTSVRRQKCQPSASSSLLAAPTPVASSSIVSNSSDTIGDTDELISSLVKCRGDVIWAQLRERKALLVSSLQAANNKPTAEAAVCADYNRILTHTASLHCTLALEVMKNRAKIRQIQSRLSAAVNQLDGFLDGEQCELLVLRSEQTRAEARVNALQKLREELLSQSGIFKVLSEERVEDRQGTDRQIMAVDKAILNKKAEINELLASLDTNERKILSARDCLLAVFNGFHKDVSLNDSNKFRGIQVELPQECISSIWQFYEERIERRKNKIKLSLDFDVTDDSISEPLDINNPKFVDELRIYLKKFPLEKNRKLVFDSGEQIWVFETLQWSIGRIHTALQKAEITCSLMCPSTRLSRSLQQLIDNVQMKCSLEVMAKRLNKWKRNEVNIDLKSKSEEDQIIDKVKKCLNENLLSLQKSSKIIDVGMETLQLWSSNEVKKYISPTRTVDGKTYKEYESIYNENLRLSV